MYAWRVLEVDLKQTSRKFYYYSKFYIQFLIKSFSNEFFDLKPMRIGKVCVRCAWDPPQAHLMHTFLQIKNCLEFLTKINFSVFFLFKANENRESVIEVCLRLTSSTPEHTLFFFQILNSFFDQKFF